MALVRVNADNYDNENPDDLHCSAVTRELGEPAPGSAGSMQHVVLVELPLPWPKKIEGHPLLAAVDLDGIKVFAIAGATPVGAEHQIVSYMASSRPGETTFSRSARSVSTASIASSVIDSVNWIHDVGSATTDLLICTHGSRDRCCGQYGTLLHIEILAAAPAGIDVWKASHLGGHRFAPTTLSFPDGLCWAYVAGETMLSILDRTADPAVVAAQLRGAVALETSALQAADAAVFADRGWDWLDNSRSFVLSAAGATTTLVATSADARVSVVVEQLDPMPVPPCGEPIEHATKQAKPVRATIVVA